MMMKRHHHHPEFALPASPRPAKRAAPARDEARPRGTKRRAAEAEAEHEDESAAVAQPLGLWERVGDAVAAHFAEQAARDRQRRQLRPLVEVTVDPQGLQHAQDSSAHCEGDDRLRRVQVMLDSFGFERHDTQKLWHWHMVAACLPHIYGKVRPSLSLALSLCLMHTHARGC